jgi:hypothetical protein
MEEMVGNICGGEATGVVARERRRGDRPPTKYKCKFNGGIYI